MAGWLAACGVVAGLAGAAAGQTVLYGVRENGDVLRINPATGVAHVLGSSGVPCQAAHGIDGSFGRPGSHGAVLTAGGDGEWADRVAFVDRWWGTLSAWETTTGRPAGYRVSGMTGPGWFH